MAWDFSEVRSTIQKSEPVCSEGSRRSLEASEALLRAVDGHAAAGALPVHRHPDLAIGREGQVGLLDLGGQRGEGELPSAEVPFGPELALPSPCGVMPVADH